MEASVGIVVRRHPWIAGVIFVGSVCGILWLARANEPKAPIWSGATYGPAQIVKPTPGLSEGLCPPDAHGAYGWSVHGQCPTPTPTDCERRLDRIESILRKLERHKISYYDADPRRTDGAVPFGVPEGVPGVIYPERGSRPPLCPCSLRDSGATCPCPTPGAK